MAPLLAEKPFCLVSRSDPDFPWLGLPILFIVKGSLRVAPAPIPKPGTRT